MDVALAERLICPRAHAATPLVIRADAVIAGELVHGVVACPVCRTEWPVTDGVVCFGQTVVLAAMASPDVLACAAYLSVTDPGLLIVADGASAELCAGLANEFGSVVVPLDPANPNDPRAIYGAPTVPFGEGTVRGAVLLRTARDDSFVASAMRTLAPHARMVAAAIIALPHGMREIARDEHVWIAEKEPAAVTVPLLRRRG